MAISDLEGIWSAVSPFRFDWIQVEVSAACNASCAYCVLSCYKGDWAGGLMDMETFDRIEPSFPQTDLVFLQGWGEPLLHPHFWEMARRAKASGARVGFTTNGTLLDKENLSRLLEVKVDIMGISLAGATAATNERFRKGCDLAAIDAALRKLNKMKRDRQRKAPSVHLAFMLLQSNWRELERLPGLAAEWGADQVVVNNLNFIASQAMEEESLFLHPELWPRIMTTLEKVKEEAREMGIELHYYRPNAKEPSALCTENITKACFISYRGDVSPCVLSNISTKKGRPVEYYFQNRAYPLEKFLFGNINEQPLAEIWNFQKAREFRSAFEKRLGVERPGMTDLPEPCRRCYKLFEGRSRAHRA